MTGVARVGGSDGLHRDCSRESGARLTQPQVKVTVPIESTPVPVHVFGPHLGFLAAELDSRYRSLLEQKWLVGR